MGLQAIFLDRDGVLNEDRPEGVARWEDFRFLPGVLAALAELARARIPVAIVTNQALVGRGEASRDTVEEIHRRAVAAIREAGGDVRGVYACFHAAGAGCACRKPAPGLLETAARELGVSLAAVAFVGDDGRDLEAARRAGARPVLVRTGKGRATEARVRAGELPAAAVYADLGEVARAAVGGQLA